MTDTPKFSPVGLTFDDVLLLPAHYYGDFFVDGDICPL